MFCQGCQGSLFTSQLKKILQQNPVISHVVFIILHTSMKNTSKNTVYIFLVTEWADSPGPRWSSGR